MTDERLYRDPPREAIPTPDNVGPQYEPPGRSMLGAEQREWLVDTITNSEATWTVWADEVLTVPFRIGSAPLALYPVQGGWDGYTRERQRTEEAIAAVDIDNYVTLTGDMHCYVAAYYQDAYPGRVAGGEGVAQGERVGVEFVTPAMTSINVAEAFHLTRARRRSTRSVGPNGTTPTPSRRSGMRRMSQWSETRILTDTVAIGYARPYQRKWRARAGTFRRSPAEKGYSER